MTERPRFDPARELALVRDYLASEEAAIKEFGERLRCVPRILSAENHKLGRPLDEHDLADLIQDVVVVVLRKLHQYAGSAPLEAWIYRVCCLELMNGVRRKYRSRRMVEGTPAELIDVDAQANGDRLGQRELIYEALDRLDEAEAEAVRLKHFEGLTFEEMGQRLNVSPNTLKTRYYRGLSRLQHYLESRIGGTR